MSDIAGGLTGTMLRVNLTEGEVKRVPTPSDRFERFLGARGVGASMLFDELEPHTDPLGPRNKLIFLTGPLVGTMAPGANKVTVSFRSPLSETYSFSLCGGHLAPELKFAGFDGMVVEGRSDQPVYLWIDNGTATLRDAAHLWGKLTHDTEDAIREELGDPEIRVASIGPAGEKRVRYASIQADYHREFGRGGAGAVMGSKHLKAVAVRGTGSVEVADPAALAQIAEQVYAELAEHPKARLRRRFGTPEMVEATNQFGYWATRNFTTGHFDEADRLTGPELKQKVYIGDNSCYACPVACGKVSPVTRGPFAGQAIEGPEFETIGLLGANCGVSDPEAIIAATAICDAYGFDTMSAGASISLAMEAFERGILGPEDTGGVDLRFGNGEALIAITRQIAERTGLGDVLAEGSKRAAERFGVPDLAMQVKGQELATYEPRGVVGMGLSYAISPKGGHHMIAPTMGLETAGDPARRLIPDGKAKMVRDTQLIMTIVDSLALCASMRFVLGLESMLGLYRAVTGIAIEEQEALLMAERVDNLERLFNLREGLARKDDTLPRRLLKEAMPSGASQGNTVPLDQMLDEYYGLMGWDSSGVPTAERMQELGLQKEWEAAQKARGR
ncbi:MAG TPA: aldehyde ferredoxin oxidoreductase family protein [Thermoguttaceae bacterium]|nr:aldehyde ferredoxin oxidoreductase family protein [Thermoguttaceae bacterium]